MSFGSSQLERGRTPGLQPLSRTAPNLRILMDLRFFNFHDVFSVINDFDGASFSSSQIKSLDSQINGCDLIISVPKRESKKIVCFQVCVFSKLKKLVTARQFSLISFVSVGENKEKQMSRVLSLAPLNFPVEKKFLTDKLEKTARESCRV